jgi:hypothetical protein
LRQEVLLIYRVRKKPIFWRWVSSSYMDDVYWSLFRAYGG